MILETFENRYFRFALTALLLLALFPICCAYADDYEGGGGGSHDIGGSYPNFGTVWYGPNSYSSNDGVSHNRYGVVANTKYDAAMYLCMGGNFDWGQLTNTKKAKLLDNDVFTVFASRFKTGKPELTEDWSSDSGIVMAWNSARQMYGETYCWNVSYTDDQLTVTQRNIRAILNEEDTPSGGVGSSGNTVNGSVTEDDTTIDYTLIEVKPWADSSVDINYIAIKTSEYNTMQSFADSHDYVICANYGGFADYPASCVTVAAVDPTKIRFEESNHSMYFGASYESIYMNDRGAQIREISGYKCAVSNAAANSAYILPVPDGVRPIYYRNLKDDGAPEVPAPGGGGDTPVEPPVTWPDPPSKPVGGGPDVPGPGDDPVDPTPPNPWIPIPGDDIDITGDDFQDLLDALNEHCIHLQNSIQSNVSQLWSLQSEFLEAQFSDLFTVLADLKDYLHTLFEWLAERMDFNISVEGGQYDDTSVVYWLKQIWAKLGDGINTRPTDPVTEPDDWWAWLLALMGNFVAMLLAFGSDRLGDVASAFQTLTSKFPFSLPWDLAAMFALLDATPVIPEFDLPCFALTSSGLSEVGQYHITLEAFDGVWEGIRWVERLGFVVMLIRNTDKLMSVMRRAVGR